MNIRGIWKPEFVYRPRQILLRMTRNNPGPELVDVHLPWGLVLSLRPDEHIGRAIYQRGVFDLGVSEALWRLAEPGTWSLDVGANIGYTTSILCARAGTGRVDAFEPVKRIYDDLERNCARWARRCTLTAHQIALSSTAGMVVMGFPKQFSANRGIARVAMAGDAYDRGERVQARTLDDAVGEGFVHLTKIDVEGHEQFVLEGAERLLGERRLMHIVFEENRPYPTAATERLVAAGYKLFRICRPFAGPMLVGAGEAIRGPTWDSPAYLATLDADDVRSRFREKGWRCLRRTSSFTMCG